jgi:hypothetical protein
LVTKSDFSKNQIFKFIFYQFFNKLQLSTLFIGRVRMDHLISKKIYYFTDKNSLSLRLQTKEVLTRSICVLNLPRYHKSLLPFRNSQINLIPTYFTCALEFSTIDTGSPLIRCNFTTLEFRVLFSRKKCFQTKNWFFIPVNLTVVKKGEGRCHCLLNFSF